MMLRSASTGVLSSLLSVSSLSENSIDAELFHHAHQFSSLGVAAANTAASPPPPHLKSAEDGWSTDGGDWEFEGGGKVPWPRLRKVQSDTDLQALCRASSYSASFAAADSLLSAPQPDDVPAESLLRGETGAFRAWGRRTKIRRGCSLSAIPSARHMEVDVGVGISEFEVNHLSTCGEADESRESLELDELSGFSFDASSKADVLRLHFVGQTMKVGSLEKEPIAQIAGSRGAPTYSGISGDDFVSENTGLSGASSLQSEFATFSGRYSENERRGAGMHLSSAVESSKAGLLSDTPRSSGSVAQKESLGQILATDLGIGIGGGGGNCKISGGGSQGGAGDRNAVEAQYKRMLEDDAGNPLLLRNYAKFLFEVKKDPLKAEVYYERAILASPGDGEILGHYAKLIWDVYRDEERAGRYFDQALEACPDDCYLNAAYASFLWSSEEPEEPLTETCYNNSFMDMSGMYGYGSAAAASA